MSDDGTTPGGGGADKLARPWVLLALAALLAGAAALIVALAGGSSRPALPGGVRQAAPGSGFFGTLALPARAAPAIDLHDDGGRRVTLAAYRGRAVLVTFLYTHCPDVCPLIASNLGVALNQLGARASRAQLIAISVDPRGDTPAAVARFLAVHRLAGRMEYLIGSPSQLARTWAAWSVGSSRQIGQPDRVAHSALVYGITAGGVLKTLYPASFDPGQIVHDVPKLAAG
jgi:protein SCO1/2